MSYLGAGNSGYECTTCPNCGELMWNGCCENPDCYYHFTPLDEDGIENEN